MIKERQAENTTDDSVNFATVQEESNQIESESWANANAIDNDTPIEKQPIHSEEQPEEQESEVDRYWRYTTQSLDRRITELNILHYDF